MDTVRPRKNNGTFVGRQGLCPALFSWWQVGSARLLSTSERVCMLQAGLCLWASLPLQPLSSVLPPLQPLLLWSSLDRANNNVLPMLGQWASGPGTLMFSTLALTISSTDSQVLLREGNSSQSKQCSGSCWDCPCLLLGEVAAGWGLTQSPWRPVLPTDIVNRGTGMPPWPPALSVGSQQEGTHTARVHRPFWLACQNLLLKTSPCHRSQITKHNHKVLRKEKE